MTNAAAWTIRLAESVEDRKALPATAGPIAREDQTVVITEWEIVRRAQGYDEDALQSLYETYYPKIYSYAFLQMGDVQAAEDLASDVMLKMIESLQSYKLRGLPF